MVKYVVRNGQNIIDIAIILTGSADRAFEICRENKMRMLDELIVGTTIRYSGGIEDREIYNDYRLNNIHPATGDVLDDNYKIFDYTFDYTFE